MYTGFKHLHSTMAYVFLALVALAFLVNLLGLLGKKSFSATHKRLALFGLIATHLQLVFGLVMYFISPLGMKNMSGDAMKNSFTRLYVLEHPLTMILAIVLITIGYSRSKKQSTSAAKFKAIVVFFGLGLLLSLARIPWDVWPTTK